MGITIPASGVCEDLVGLTQLKAPSTGSGSGECLAAGHPDEMYIFTCVYEPGNILEIHRQMVVLFGW